MERWQAISETLQWLRLMIIIFCGDFRAGMYQPVFRACDLLPWIFSTENIRWVPSGVADAVGWEVKQALGDEMLVAFCIYNSKLPEGHTQKQKATCIWVSSSVSWCSLQYVTKWRVTTHTLRVILLRGILPRCSKPITLACKCLVIGPVVSPGMSWTANGRFFSWDAEMPGVLHVRVVETWHK